MSILLLVSCNESVEYKPESLRADIVRLIDANQYGSACRLIQNADPKMQAEYDGGGYLAVAEDLIYLPGVDSSIFYEADRDWCFPGTSDAVEDEDWQDEATRFAEVYNQIRLRMTTEELE